MVFLSFGFSFLQKKKKSKKKELAGSNVVLLFQTRLATQGVLLDTAVFQLPLVVHFPFLTVKRISLLNPAPQRTNHCKEEQGCKKKQQETSERRDLAKPNLNFLTRLVVVFLFFLTEDCDSVSNRFFIFKLLEPPSQKIKFVKKRSASSFLLFLSC